MATSQGKYRATGLRSPAPHNGHRGPESPFNIANSDVDKSPRYPGHPSLISIPRFARKSKSNANSGSSADTASCFHRRLHREFSNSPDTLCQSTMTELDLLRKSQVILFTRTRQSIGGFGPRPSPSMSIKSAVIYRIGRGFFLTYI